MKKSFPQIEKGKEMKILIGYVISKESCGINKYLYNVLNALKGSNVEIHVLTSDYSLELQKRMEEYGVRMITIERLIHPVKRYRQTKRLAMEENYDVAYFNISEAMNCICNIAIRNNSNAQIITHSHSAGSDEMCRYKRVIYQMLNAIARKVIVNSTDYFYACSSKAGKWLFGDKIVARNKVRIIRNTIDTKKFKFNKQERAVIREKLHVKDDEVVYGFVGNLVYQKNPIFLIKIFYQIIQKDRKNKLIVVGDGMLRNEMENLVKELEIDNHVVFTGAVSNVESYMSAMDVFLFPSNFEGLGIVGIEAQTNGLECYFSDGVPEEVTISKHAHFISLSKNEVEWAKEIMKRKAKKRDGIDLLEDILIDSEDQEQEFKNIFLHKIY